MLLIESFLRSHPSSGVQAYEQGFVLNWQSPRYPTGRTVYEGTLEECARAAFDDERVVIPDPEIGRDLDEDGGL